MLSLISAPVVFSICALITGCSSASDSSSDNGGQPGSAGSPAAGANDGGSSSAGADAGEGGTSNTSADAGEGGEGGTDATSAGGSSAGNSSAGAGGTKPSNPTNSPCSYTVSGGQTFPEGDAMYVCTVNSRVYQKSGKGAFNALIGAGFSTTDGDTSTFACSLDSNTAPKAGDTWTMSKADHPGNCDLAFSHNQVARLWHATSSPLSGEVSIKFNSVTVKNGMYNPEDVYYLYDLTITAQVKGQTEGAPDVTVTSSFVNMALPLGA